MYEMNVVIVSINEIFKKDDEENDEMKVDVNVDCHVEIPFCIPPTKIGYWLNTEAID